MNSETGLRLLDRMGVLLSIGCALHCALTPFIIFFFPVMMSFLPESEWVHIGLSVFIIPTALVAWGLGYRHHKNLRVFFIGVPGLLIVGAFPWVVTAGWWNPSLWMELFWMVPGSAALIYAHILNRKSCQCAHHPHHSPH